MVPLSNLYNKEGENKDLKTISAVFLKEYYPNIVIYIFKLQN